MKKGGSVLIVLALLIPLVSASPFLDWLWNPTSLTGAATYEVQASTICGGVTQCGCGDVLNESLIFNQSLLFCLNDFAVKIIANNSFLDCNGFSVVGSQNFTVLAENVVNLTITNCNFNNSLGVGIKFSSVINSSVFSNFVSSNKSFVVDFSSNNSVYNNTFVSSAGMIFNSSSDNNVFNNSIQTSGFVINLLSGSGNRFFNNIFNRTIGFAVSSVSGNFWNTSLQSGPNIKNGPFIGGNFWSDYNGLDTDFDGVGDTLVPHNSSIVGAGDFLPLSKEYSVCPNTTGIYSVTGVDAISSDIVCNFVNVSGTLTVSNDAIITANKLVVSGLIKSYGVNDGNITLNTSNLVVTSSGIVSASMGGFSGGCNSGGGSGGGHEGAGGSYGGFGGLSNFGPSSLGKVYGNLYNPVEFGSGGASTQSLGCSGQGGSGGGVVTVDVDRFDLFGILSVNGGNGGSVPAFGSGGGSGGTINIQASVFNGNGSLQAKGGNGAVGSVTRGGGGGGGRILFRTQNVSVNFSCVVSGGAGSGGGSFPGNPGSCVHVIEKTVCSELTNGTFSVSNNFVTSGQCFNLSNNAIFLGYGRSINGSSTAVKVNGSNVLVSKFFILNSGVGVFADPGVNVTVANNSFENVSNATVFDGFNNSFVLDNVYNNISGVAVRLFNSNNNSVRRNVVTNSAVGVSVVAGQDNMFDNNSVLASVVLVNTSFDNLTSNFLSSVSVNGSQTFFSLNNFSSLNVSGFNGTFSLNNGSDVFVSGSFNTFFSNNFTSSKVINVSGLNNLFYDNILFRVGGGFVVDAVSGNFWNTSLQVATNVLGGPKIGGNFWSDYVGGDTDFDGVGDTLIPHNSSIFGAGDFLPLLPQVNLSGSKSDGLDPVSNGSQLVYQILLINTGASSVSVNVTESFPNVTFDYSQPLPVVGNNFWVVTVPGFSSKTINITVNVSSTVSNNTLLNNSALVRWRVGGQSFNFSVFENTTVSGDSFSVLDVWDSTDSKPFAGQTKFVNDPVFFFANYTSGSILSGSVCNVTFHDASSVLMSLNVSKGLYEANRTYNSVGSFFWGVSCFKNGFIPRSVNDTVIISSPSTPSGSGGGSKIPVVSVPETVNKEVLMNLEDALVVKFEVPEQPVVEDLLNKFEQEDITSEIPVKLSLTNDGNQVIKKISVRLVDETPVVSTFLLNTRRVLPLLEEVGAGIAFSELPVNGGLLTSVLLKSPKIKDLQPGETVELTLPVRLGLGLEDKKLKFVFSSFDQPFKDVFVDVKKPVLFGSAVDVNSDNKVVDLYVVVTGLDNPEGLPYDFDINFNKAPRLDFKPSLRSLRGLFESFLRGPKTSFVEQFGPYALDADKKVVFAQRFSYQDEFKDDYTLQADLVFGGKKVYTSKSKVVLK